MVLTKRANTEKGMDLASSNIASTAASTESASMDMVNIVEDYSTAKDLANTSSEHLAEKTGLAKMAAYTDYGPAYSAESTKDMIIERVTKGEFTKMRKNKIHELTHWR